MARNSSPDEIKQFPFRAEPKKLKSYLDTPLILQMFEKGEFEGKPYYRFQLLNPADSEIIEFNSGNKQIMIALEGKTPVELCPCKVMFYVVGRSVCIGPWPEGIVP